MERWTEVFNTHRRSFVIPGNALNLVSKFLRAVNIFLQL